VASLSLLRHVVVLLVTAVLAGCGGEDDGGEEPGEAPEASAGPVHVHGLGVNRKDGALLIATHTGLFRVKQDERKATRIGDSLQDTMGFTVVGPDRFLGSGHPGPGENRPPNLGLIESRDGGRSWDSRSLLGEADFHVLRARGPRVYGFDATNQRLLVSRDGGKDWKELNPPGLVIDLVSDPGAPERLIASTDRTLFSSSDGGQRWRSLSPRGDEPPGLLTWPTANRLYHVDGAGQVRLSGDGGQSWRARGSIGGQPAALLGQGKNELYAALPDGTIRRSTDGGVSWGVRSTP
jgi:photosystem II stability/assembly factor-like uncharacterized protein